LETVATLPAARDAVADAGQVARIERCLVDFDAALRAAARVQVSREGAQAAALTAMERSLALQRRAAAARRDVERALIALRDGVRRSPRLTGSVAVERARAAARAAEAAARKAEMLARRLRATAETTARCAMAALLAAIQADPARGNPGFDPEIARASRAGAERAARDASAAIADGREGADGARGVVIPLTPDRRAAKHVLPGNVDSGGRSTRPRGP
jgi:hypothetical protein